MRLLLKSSDILNLITWVILTFLVLFLAVNNLYLNYFVLFVLFVVIASNLNGQFFSLSLPFWLSFLWCSLSLVYIENGNYISEQRRNGELIGSFVRYFVYNGSFLLSSYFWFLFFNAFSLKYKTAVSIEKRKRYFIFFSYAVFLSFSFVCLYVLIFYGSAFLDKVDRYTFWNSIPDYFIKIKGFSPFVFFICGILFAIDKKYTALFFSAFSFLLLVFLGEKATPFIMGFVFFVLSYSVYSGRSFLSIIGVKFLFSGIVLVSVLLYVLYLAYMIMSNGNGDFWGWFLNRTLGLQAHVWYGTDKFIFEGGDLNYGLFSSGLINLMYLVAPASLVDSMLELGITFTMGFPAIVIFNYGYIFSFFLILLMGISFGFFLNFLAYSIRNLDPFLILMSYFMYRGFIWSYQMGDVFSLFKIYFLLAIFLSGLYIFSRNLIFNGIKK